jgi:pimeloyl-ACP methyl ester carboxylesterase
MYIDVEGTRLWFDVDGPALVPDGDTMRERPTVVLLHGGPGSPLLLRRARDHEPDRVRTLARRIRRAGVCGAPPGPSRRARAPVDAREVRLDRIAEGFRRAGGDGPAAVARALYGGERDSVSDDEWADCWKLVGRSIPGEQESARTVLNKELNPYGLRLMQTFDVVDRLGVIECPRLVCCGELDPVMPPSAHRELADALRDGVGELVVLEDAGHFTWKDTPERYWPVLTGFVAAL